MDTVYSENNHIIMVGKVTSDKRFSHEIYGEKFYIFDLSVPRLSGNSDIIPITISERLITDEMLTEGNKLLIKGQFRSYNSYENERNKLILTVFAKDVEEIKEAEEQEESDIVKKDETTNEGEYYLYLFNNNFGTSVSNPSYDWTKIEGIETSVTEGVSSYFYKYKIDENQRNYYLVHSFQVPYSAYVSSVQEYKENVIVDSGMKGIFGEYDENGSLLQEFQMKMDNKFIYRVYKYDFMGFYFA